MSDRPTKIPRYTPEQMARLEERAQRWASERVEDCRRHGIWCDEEEALRHARASLGLSDAGAADMEREVAHG